MLILIKVSIHYNEVMARLPRLNLPNIPQHVVQRGNNRQLCFFSDYNDKKYINELLTLLQNKRVKTVIDSQIFDVDGELIVLEDG